MRSVFDSLVSVATRLGTSLDKSQTASYSPRELGDQQLEATFRASWIMRKTVTVPALDATRKWRQWRGPLAEDIRRAEDRLLLRRKTYQARWVARLYGGAALLIHTDSSRMESPLDPLGETLRGVSVLSRRHLVADTIEDDATSMNFGMPRRYVVSTTQGVRYVHPSRVVRHVGDELPPLSAQQGSGYGWGDSILQGIYDACRNLDTTMANIAALVFDAKTDIVKIPGLSESISSPKFETALVARFEAARMLKGNHGVLILDGEEDYDSKTYNFGGLDTIADRFMQVASGAADIPMTRLLGMSPAGMNSTGESDLLNYYDRIASMQATEIAPEMSLLDEMIVRSVGGEPERERYVWGSLRQLTEQQKSESRHRAAQTLKLLVESGVYDDDTLARVAHELFGDLDTEVPDEADDVPDPVLQGQSPLGRPGPGPNTGVQ